LHDALPISRRARGRSAAAGGALAGHLFHHRCTERGGRQALALTADVVVIGGGLAGSCAALAAREEGADVLLVARAPGATAVSSGAIDFAASDDDASIGEAARKLARSDDHPYALLGNGLVPAIDDALQLLRRHLSALGL